MRDILKQGGTISAIQFNSTNEDEVREFCNKGALIPLNFVASETDLHRDKGDCVIWDIETERWVWCRFGNWIVRGERSRLHVIDSASWGSNHTLIGPNLYRL